MKTIIYKQVNINKLSPQAKPCPRCSGYLVKRESKYGKFKGCSNFPKCTYSEK